MAYYSVLDVSPTTDQWIPEYLPHLNDRTAGSTSHHYLIEAKDEFT